VNTITPPTAEAWQQGAKDLACWAMAHLINRIDAWGLYVRWTDPQGAEHMTRTSPYVNLRGTVTLSERDLVQHFCGVTGQIMGAHTTSKDDMCKWLCWDFDNHDHSAETATKNLAQAHLLVEHLHDYGFEAIIEDSNGDGGYHVWVLLSSPAPCGAVYAFVQLVTQELSVTAEGFPKQASIGDGYGNFVRMPGKHHTRDHWSRICINSRWHEGADAVAALLNAPVNDIALLPDPPKPQEQQRTASINRELNISGGRFSDTQIALDCLWHLGSDVADDRALWIKVGQILFDIDQGLLGEWESWSQQSSKYKPGECASKWKGFGRRSGKAATLGTLIYLARNAGAAIPYRSPDPPKSSSSPFSPIEPQPPVTPLPARMKISGLLKDYPELREAVIDGLLRRGEVLGFIGGPKTSKTWAVIALALAVGRGANWFDHACIQGRVLLIDNELQQSTLSFRLAKVMKAYGLHSSEMDERIEVISLRGQSMDVHQLGRLFASIKPREFDLVIVDSIYHTFPDDCDENSNSDIRKVYAAYQRYAEQLDAGLVVVHHASKGAQGNKSITDVGAGAGSASRAVDSHVILRAHDEPGAVVLDAVLRSFPPPAASCWQFKMPIFWPATELDPTNLLRENKPRTPKNESGVKPEKPKKAMWTPQQFVAKYVNVSGQELAALQARAMADDLAPHKVKQLLEQGVAVGACKLWPGKAKKKAQYSTVDEPLMEVK